MRARRRSVVVVVESIPASAAPEYESDAATPIARARPQRAARVPRTLPRPAWSTLLVAEPACLSAPRVYA